MTLITPLDPVYPPLLRTIGHPPPLYYKGRLEVLQSLCISVVGSRKMTTYGAGMVREFVVPLVKAGLTIVSGLAYGVDAAAHEAALAAGGACIAILGGGLDRLYPAAHTGLADDIAKTGCILTEYPPDEQPFPAYFPARNRLIAGMSRVTLIVEAGERSGTLSTGRHALDYGREACVIPADITREEGLGAIKLWQQGARPVARPEDVLALYEQDIPFIVQDALRPALTGSAATIYDCLSCGPKSVAEIQQSIGLTVAQVQSVLSVLELDGYITYHQQQWQKTSLS